MLTVAIVYTKIAPVQTTAQPIQPQFQKSTPVVQQQQQFAQPQIAQMTPQQQAHETERLHEQHKQEHEQLLQQAQTLPPAPIDTSANVKAPVSPVSPVRAESPIIQAQDNRVSLPTPISPQGPGELERHVSAGQVLDFPSPQEPAPLQPHTQDTRPEMPGTTRPLSSNGVTVTASAPPTTVPASAIPKNIATNLKHGHGADSPVMNEALAVIEEHITDMSTPRNSQLVDRRPATNDSGSEYSIEHPGMDPRRMSYINGSETDEEEEEERRLNRAEVNRWSEQQVSEYLASVGVEEKHCAVFREQEITGDVLLAMDQPTVFLKEFDLGSVGRRLKTWQKIKALQDEVASLPSMMTNARRQTSNFSSQYGSDAGGDRVFSSSGMSGPSRVTSSGGRPDSRSTVNRYSHSQRQRTMDSINSVGSIDSQTTAYGEQPQQTRPATGAHRPSAANIRDLNHSRRHSSVDNSTLVSSESAAPIIAQNNTAGAPQNHKKLPSFDRNWTMGNQPSSARESGVRPVSQAGAIPEQAEEGDDLRQKTPYDFDRGYFSGTEVEGGSNRTSRNVLKKRMSMHSRNSSYTDEARQRSATTVGNRNSRFGSMDSLQQSHVSPAGAKYYGLAGSRRTPSGRVPNSPLPPPKDPHASQPSPTVTMLEDRGDRSPAVGANKEWLNPAIDARSPGGFRAISDAVTGTERKILTDKLQHQHSMEVASPGHSSTRSPSRTGSSTPSGGPSMDLGDDGSKTSMSSATPKAARKKSKKETSAYTRGLLKISPKEAMKDCDYSGWMKKKSTNLMTTWKPRLFILKGRRLSYYYSENDTEEKGLIDISFHRVLPADQDRITGLHAQLTGAMGSSTPNNATQTTAQQDAAAAAAKDGVSPTADNNMFIFKLVPPRAGLSRAVTFTKPTVHYFAVENVAVARLWMAALMKATIEREGDGKVTTTYQQKTISLRKAREMRQRPPALRDDDDVQGPLDGGVSAGGNGAVGLGLSIEDREGEEKEEERVKEERRGYRGVQAAYEGQVGMN